MIKSSKKVHKNFLIYRKDSNKNDHRKCECKYGFENVNVRTDLKREFKNVKKNRYEEIEYMKRET
jgi:hypothetical protein